MNEHYRKISIVFEVERAIKFLRLGLAEIQKITPENAFYDPIFIFLSSGLERLFKVMLCLNFLEVNGRLPKPDEVWAFKMGHDLLYLKNEVERFTISLDLPFGKDDYNIITNDDFINRVCTVLSEYGKYARYFNLDAILGRDQEFNTVKNWEKLEADVLKDLYGEKRYYQLLTDFSLTEKFYKDSNRVIIIKLEKFFRALTRQFIFGNFSSITKTYTFQLSDFSDIEEEQLGETDYRNYENHETIKRSY